MLGVDLDSRSMATYGSTSKGPVQYHSQGVPLACRRLIALEVFGNAHLLPSKIVLRGERVLC